MPARQGQDPTGGDERDRTTTGRTTTGRTTLALAAIVLLAAAVRVLPLGLDSFWLDETSTARASRLPFGNMLAERARAGHPPVFFALTWLLHRAWLAVGGSLEVMLRLPAALAGTLCVPLAYALTRRMALAAEQAAGWARTARGAAPVERGESMATGTALLAAALLAVHPLQVELSTQARAYSLVAALGLATTLLLARALEGAAGRPAAAADGTTKAARPAATPSTVATPLSTLAAYTSLSLLAVHVHYSALLVVGAQAAWLLLRRRWRLAAGALAALAGVLPWYLWGQSVGYVAESKLVWIPPVSQWTWLFAVTGQVADLDVRWMAPVALAAGATVVVLVAGLAAVGTVAAARPRRPATVSLALAVWLLPLAAGVVVSLLGPNVLHKARYFATSSALLPGMVALGLAAVTAGIDRRRTTGGVAGGLADRRGSSKAPGPSPTRRRLAGGLAAGVLVAFAWMAWAEIQEPVGTDWKASGRTL